MTYDPLSGFSEEVKQPIEVIKKELPNYKRGRYEIKMRIYEGNVLHHRTIRTSDLGTPIKTDIGEFNLNTNWLFKEKKFVLHKLWNRLKGIRQTFIAIYDKNSNDPFRFSLAYPKIGGGHLNTIKQSNALRDALKSWVQTKFDTRMLIIILAVVGMLGVYLLYSMGYIDLSSIIKR